MEALAAGVAPTTLLWSAFELNLHRSIVWLRQLWVVADTTMLNLGGVVGPAVAAYGIERVGFVSLPPSGF